VTVKSQLLEPNDWHCSFPKSLVVTVVEAEVVAEVVAELV
jgi:hypothetical protein